MHAVNTTIKPVVMDQKSLMERKSLNLSKSTIDMLSGSCAGLVATFVSHPLDTVKVRFQVSQHDRLTLGRCISDIYRFEGVSTLFYPLSLSFQVTLLTQCLISLDKRLFQRCYKSNGRSQPNFSNVSICPSKNLLQLFSIFPMLKQTAGMRC